MAFLKHLQSFQTVGSVDRTANTHIYIYIYICETRSTNRKLDRSKAVRPREKHSNPSKLENGLLELKALLPKPFHHVKMFMFFQVFHMEDLQRSPHRSTCMMKGWGKSHFSLNAPAEGQVEDFC